MDKPLHSFDEARLTRYLEENIQGFEGPVQVKKFAVGQSNPTFLLTTKRQNYVLRRKPPGKLLKSAHAIDREFAVFDALKNTDVPVPKPYHLCSDDDVIGSMFYIMSFEEGRTYQEASLPDLNPEQRKTAYDEVIKVLATLHSVNLTDVGLSNFGKPGNYFERQLDRWTKQYRASETEPLEAMETLIQWLSNNLPTDDEQVSLIHGDYKFDNIMLNPADLQVQTLLDWELSTLGHPYADLAFFCMCLRLPPKGYVGGLDGLDRKSMGIPTESEIISRYCELRNINAIEHWTFYLAFSFFRLAAIAQGVMKRALEGNASSKEALEVGRSAGPLAQKAVELIERGE